MVQKARPWPEGGKVDWELELVPVSSIPVELKVFSFRLVDDSCFECSCGGALEQDTECRNCF